MALGRRAESLEADLAELVSTGYVKVDERGYKITASGIELDQLDPPQSSCS